MHLIATGNNQPLVTSAFSANKEGYYLGLRQTQGTLRSYAPNWQPWILFFLKAFEDRGYRKIWK